MLLSIGAREHRRTDHPHSNLSLHGKHHRRAMEVASSRLAVAAAIYHRQQQEREALMNFDGNSGTSDGGMMTSGATSSSSSFWQPWLNFEAANVATARRYAKAFAWREERPKATSLHRKPSSAWRRERRRDPIQSEALDMSAARNASSKDSGSNHQSNHQQNLHHHSRPSVIVPAATTTQVPSQPGMGSGESKDEILTGATTEDTAVTPTASVTPSAATRGQNRTGMRTAGVASDPAIDEHFKRSLGLKDYAAVFNAANADKDTGLSVDDHFAKALGETWTRLQATSRSKD